MCSRLYPLVIKLVTPLHVQLMVHTYDPYRYCSRLYPLVIKLITPLHEQLIDRTYDPYHWLKLVLCIALLHSLACHSQQAFRLNLQWLLNCHKMGFIVCVLVRVWPVSFCSMDVRLPWCYGCFEYLLVPICVPDH